MSDNQVNERGPGPLMMSIYIILFLIIGSFLSITLYKKFFALPSAKLNAVKTMHAQAIKYISGEIKKCKLGESTFMSGDQNCPPSAIKVIDGAVNTMTDKNPYKNSFNAVSSNSSYVLGQISLSSSNSTLLIKSCFDEPCSKEKNRLQDSIEIK